VHSKTCVRHGSRSELMKSGYKAITWNFSTETCVEEGNRRSLIRLARPTRFERVTYGLEGRKNLNSLTLIFAHVNT